MQYFIAITILLLSQCLGICQFNNIAFVANVSKYSAGTTITNVTGGLVNWWQYEDNPSGTTSTNSIAASSANYGILSSSGGGGDPTFGAGYIPAPEMDLLYDGIGGYVQLQNNFTNGSVPITLSMWLSRTTSSGTLLYDSDNDGSQGWFLYFTGGNIIFQIPCAGSDMKRVAIDPSTTSTYYQIIVTWSGVLADYTQVHIYVNGTECTYAGSGNANGSGAHNQYYAAANTYIVKSGTGASGTWFAGRIGDVREYNRVLANGEITMLNSWYGQ